MFAYPEYCDNCQEDKDFCRCWIDGQRRRKAREKHDHQLLTRFAKYLNERCDLNVENMVRPFMEGDRNE